MAEEQIQFDTFGIAKCLQWRDTMAQWYLSGTAIQGLLTLSSLIGHIFPLSGVEKALSIIRGIWLFAEMLAIYLKNHHNPPQPEPIIYLRMENAEASVIKMRCARGLVVRMGRGAAILQDPRLVGQDGSGITQRETV